MLLRPLHKSVFSFLSRIEQDGTFDQLKPLRQLMELAKLDKPLFSYDLSSATDRFPVFLQEAFLSYFLGKERAYLWREILTGRDWWFQDQPLRYACGQPMGAYSSWAVFAATHHMVVQMAAARVGWREWFPFYALLGDDIVIADEKVAIAYKTIMDYLGVSISEDKSLQSTNGVAEFAKHLLAPDGDYSPVGVKAWIAAFRNGSYLPALMEDMKSKDIIISSQDALERLLDLTKKFRTSRHSKLNHLRGLLAVVGPTGSHPLALADWVALQVSPADQRAQLSPAVSLTLGQIIGDLVTGDQDRAIGAAKKAWENFP